MVEAKILESIFKSEGFDFFTGVPCSYLKPFINYIIDSNPEDYVIAASEGEALGIAAGAYLSGKMPVVMLQNSGLGNCVNPLTSLNAISDIPCLLLVTLRGEPGKKDAAQHKLMGEITGSLMDVCEVPNQVIPDDQEGMERVLKEAKEYIDKNNKPYGLILRQGVIAPYKLQKAATNEEAEARTYAPRVSEANPEMIRFDALKLVSKVLNKYEVPTVATTGKMSRELFELADGKNCFYMVGSMGCAASIGLGVALQKPEKKSLILDGDGAVIMKMGTLATIGHYRPKNLIHVVVDNGVYETTGGQETVASSVDFLTTAAACGYKGLYFASTQQEIEDCMEKAYASDELSMVLIRVSPEPLKGIEIGRPTLTPPQVTERFKSFLAE